MISFFPTTILDRYILRKFLLSFLVIVVLFAVVISLVDYASKSDDFFKHQLSWDLILRYYIAHVSYVINFITPIMVFITTVFVVSRLSRHAEVIAMLSSGMHFLRFMSPMVLGACLIGGLSFYMYGWVTPEGSKFRLSFDQKYVKNIFENYLENMYLKIGEDQFLFLRSYDAQKNIAYGVRLFSFEGEKLLQDWSIQTMAWDTLGSVWQWTGWESRTFLDTEKNVGQKILRGNKKDTLLRVLPQDLNLNQGSEAMTMPELEKHIDYLSYRGESIVNIYLTEWHTRCLQPFIVLLLTVLGTLVSARKARSGMGSQILLGFAIAFVYILFFHMAHAAAEVGVIAPFWGLMVPNLLFTGIAVIMYRFLRR
ncbi:MAG: LptF/LptG family permease [Cytophagales bacterium]|nr:LptF/LptG family permease [Cytophagales bacterium]